MSEHAESGDSAANRPRPQASTLSERDAAILDFENSWPVQSGAKEEAIRQRFAISAARYYQVLNALIDTPAAVRHDPMLVKRLQRLRHSRVGPRSRPQGGSGRSSQTRHDD